MAGVTSFQITVPQKTGAGELPIMKLRVIVSVESEPTGGSPVTFRVSDPRTPTVTRDFGPFPSTDPDTLHAFDPAPPGAASFDAVQVIPPDTTTCPASDPCRRRYTFVFDLDSDFDAGNFCANTMTDTSETWTIEVLSGPNITSACVNSLDRNIPGSECTGPLRLVPSSEAVASVVGFPPPSQGCQEYRPGLDAVLVLDKSGSMGSSTLGGAPQLKIDALQNAVSDFVTIWDGLRADEGGLAPTDRIGIVLFDSNAGWWSAIPSGLNTFSAVSGTILGSVNTITDGGSTSIGDGLLLADGALSTVDSTRRRVLLLMSNGKQNTSEMAAVMGSQVLTHPKSNPSSTTPLANQSNYQIYSVTVGTSTAVDPVINQNLATATGGFYVNSEDDAALLSPFFLELLQNFVKFNTWETYRLVHERVPSGETYEVDVPFSTTTQHVKIVLRWPIQLGRLRLNVTPAGESDPIEETGDGVIVMHFDVPTSEVYTFIDDWRIRVINEQIIVESHADARQSPPVPFELVILGDDVVLDTHMSIVPGNYVPGDEIQLEARVTELGRPVETLSDAAGDTLVVQVVKPGVAIGDLLSDSSAAADDPFASDPSTPAGAKLHNELQKNPQSLARDDSDTVTLVHSGNGVYRGSYPVQEAGHYNLIFGLEGRTDNVGRFSRMHLETTYVRPLPDASATQIETDIQAVDGGKRLRIRVRPRTRFGSRVGPGVKNYIWFTTPGRTPIKPQDNLDGTYTAMVPFTGATPPPVSMHFLDVPFVIADEVTPDKLPVPLDNDTVLVESVTGEEGPRPRRWWLILLLAVLVLVCACFSCLILWQLFYQGY